MSELPLFPVGRIIPHSDWYMHILLRRPASCSGIQPRSAVPSASPTTARVPSDTNSPRRYLREVAPSHFDVTARLQRRVEELGGGVLELVAERDDLNRLFGNPLPGKKKELRVRYLVVVSE